MQLAATLRTWRTMCSRWQLLKYRLYATTPCEPPSVVPVENGMTVKDLANAMQRSASFVQKTLSALGNTKYIASSRLTMEMAELAVLDMGGLPLPPRWKGKSVFESQRCTDPCLISRPPVVTIMGHVNHGKTSLLDWLRKTSVVQQEAGNITQHIGAFSVTLPSGKRLTFLDTPGHALFSTLRARGANVTDIVVLVVAANDGVMPQTVESIQMAHQAKVPLVVAINKCDLPRINIGKVKQQLLRHEVQLEDFGGDVQAVEISATRGTGMDQFEECLLTQAELQGLVADPNQSTRAVVIESRTDRGLGSVATLLVQQGTLRKGQMLVAGQTWARLRSMQNERGEALNEAPPSTPVLTIGWKELPEAGQLCQQVDSETEMQDLVGFHLHINQLKQQLAALKVASSHSLSEQKSVPLVIKGDVAGSVEALQAILSSCSPKQLTLSVVRSGVGPVTDNDVEMAIDGVVVGFNVKASKTIQNLANEKNVTILTHNVIYTLLEQLKDHLGNFLEEEKHEEVVGEAEVIKVFQLTGARKATVGGCRVRKGQLVRDGMYHVLRGGKVIHQGKLMRMMREKENISLARKETECGLSFTSDPGWEEGDRVQCITLRGVRQKLDWKLEI